MKNLAVFCADVGSIKGNKFGWASSMLDGKRESGTTIEKFATCISNQIIKGVKVAIGFECPLFVPIRSNPEYVNSARKGEGNRGWSASAGTCALATGLVEVIWVMNEISRILPEKPGMEFKWTRFLETDSVFLWEAFVTSEAKGSSHTEDAELAVSHFLKFLPDPMLANAIEEESVFSLIGAAALRTGWTKDVEILSQQCLVLKV